MNSAAFKLRLAGDFDPADRGPKWLDLAVASERSDLSVGQLRRLCQTWQRTGHARDAEPGEGGAGQWRIREDADPRLAAVKTLPQLNGDFDLRTLSDKQRGELLRREAAVRGWDEAMAAGRRLDWTEQQVSDHYVSRLKLEHPGFRVSRRTLYDWRRDYRAEGRKGLVAATWQSPVDAAKPSLDGDPFFEFGKRLYLLPNRPSVKSCYDHACFEAVKEGWPTVSERHFRRCIGKLDADLVTLRREGPKALDDKRLPYLERDYSQIDANAMWVADHHRCDVLVLFNGKPTRPWLTAWQDMRSRMIVGWSMFCHDPNADVVLSSFRAAALGHGVPECVYLDNGKDFDARMLQGLTKAQRRALAGSLGGEVAGIDRRGVFPQLGCEVRHARPYNAKAKPIERTFRSFKDRFMVWHDGYVGGKPEDKPHDLARAIKAGKLLTFEELRDGFAEFVEGGYNDRPHDGQAMDGKSPRAVHAAELATLRTAPADLIDWLCCRREGPVKVRRNGVTWQGVNYGQHDAKLRELQDRQVMLVVDGSDISRVGVERLDGSILGYVPANGKVSPLATAQELREAHADLRKTQKTMTAAAKQRPRMADDPVDRMRRMNAEKRAAAAAEAGRNPPPPASVRPVGTPAAADYRQFQRQLDERSNTRKAAGAEAFDADAVMRLAGEVHHRDGAEVADVQGREAEGRYDVLDLMRRAAASPDPDEETKCP